ncbi:MAG: hypothetical protein ABID61_04835 [Candidatus Micrarchaeota archaeon]
MRNGKKIITIFERDRVGLVTEIVNMLERERIKVDFVEADLVLDKARISLGVSNFAKAKRLLVGAGYTIVNLDNKKE